MASLRKAAASRANGARSRGPSSELGKARAAQNARRHGLSRGPVLDPGARAAAEALAQALAGGDPARLDLARAFATERLYGEQLRLAEQDELQRQKDALAADPAKPGSPLRESRAQAAGAARLLSLRRLVDRHASRLRTLARGLRAQG